eukprot:3934611-Rhodomonas_salina.2
MGCNTFCEPGPLVANTMCAAASGLAAPRRLCVLTLESLARRKVVMPLIVSGGGQTHPAGKTPNRNNLLPRCKAIAAIHGSRVALWGGSALALDPQASSCTLHPTPYTLDPRPKIRGSSPRPWTLPETLDPRL